MKKSTRALWTAMLSWVCSLQDVVGDAGDTACGDLICRNYSACITDSADFESHRLPDGSLLEIHSQESDTHCECPVGRTGLQCDVEYESCEGSDHKCYHGGKCVLGLIDMYDNQQLYCNCDDAWEGQTRYAGKYCEQASISMCDEEDSTRFCLNGASCNSQYPAAGKSCTCKEGYKGPHCEYRNDDVPDCTLVCQNGGHCILGTPSDDDLDKYSGFWDISGAADDLKQFCRCLPGFYGQNCEISGESCGEEVCFNGSKCTTSSVNGETLHHCDCRFSNKGSFSFAGRFCQYEASVYCNKGIDSSLNGHLFCVNNGTCQEDAYLGCTCPQGYRGFSCEYYVEEDLQPEVAENATKSFDLIEDTECSLQCSDRGKCRHGIKDVNDEVYGSAEHLSNDSALATVDFEHCVCQDGWTGLHCDLEVVECDGGAFNCFHGGECFAEGDEQKCDCTTANSTQLGTSVFGGDLCQHPATEICTKVDDAAKYNPAKGLSFCVNHGTCKAKVTEGQPHPGCYCDESKWTGPHCEVKVAQKPSPVPSPVPVPVPVPSPAASTSSSSTKDDKKSPFQIAMIILIVCVLLPFVIFTIRQCYKDRATYMKDNVDPYARRLRESSQEGYLDEPHDHLNLAPHRSSSMRFTPSMLSKEETTELVPSSRDPFASQLVKAPLPPPQHSPFASDGPQIYMGPPKDEDGNVLHSVEIL